MSSTHRIRLTALAGFAAAVLVLAAPAGAADTYTPFETDFPASVESGALAPGLQEGREGKPSPSLDRMRANDRIHDRPLPAPPAEPVAATPTAGDGFDWGTAGLIGIGVALVALVALGLTRRSRRLALAFVFVAGIASLAVTGILAAGTDRRGDIVSPKELVDAGWFCVDVPDNWVHCVPPGVDLEANPPESMLNLNFYTHDPEATDARFLGEETLIRADVWEALPRQWPCGKRDYGFVPAEALPPYGYMYCHHFNEPKPLAAK